MITASAQPFGDRLAKLVEERESQLVLGLDPDPAKLWPSAIEAVDGDTSEPTRPDDLVFAAANVAAAAGAARAVAAHCRSVIAAVGAHCVGVKLQMATFERLGAPGWWALGEAVHAAHEQGLLVIADGKRGDVPVTAAAYAQALFGATPTPWGDAPGLGADAATVNPLLGGDSLEPLLAAAAAAGAGVFALVRTSNPGAADIEDLPVAGGAGTVTDELAALVDRMGAAHTGASGLSSLGAVVGATAPEHIARLRAAMPRAVLLIPGVGAQGGKVEDLAAAFTAGPAAALVTVSRALVDAWAESGGDHAASAETAASALRGALWRVAGGA